MVIMRRRSGPRTAKAAFVLAMAAVAGAAGAARAASPQDLYYERTMMSLAGGRCGLFAPELAAALDAAAAQARSAALRSGVGFAQLDAVRSKAGAAAAAASCRSKDMATAAARVKSAFEGYSRTMRLDLPGDVADWRAERRAPSDSAGWRLSQASTLAGAPLIFGLAGRQGERPQLFAVTQFGAGPEPYAARLLVRDPLRAPGPYLGVLKTSSSAVTPLAARNPPRWATKVFTAEARGKAGRWLVPAGARSATIYRFPDAATDALAALDPREVVTVEFLYAGASSDVARQAYVEVGDFAAGMAFISLGR
jgi:hypothetical protein